MVDHRSDADVADNALDVGNAEVADNPLARVGHHDDEAVDPDAVDADAVDADDADDAANVINFGAPQGRSVASVEDRFGFAILRLRLYWRWSQRDLQHRSGVHQSQISRLESGLQRGLSTRRLFAILRALRVGEITFRPPEPIVPPTALDLMLWGDQWERAGRLAEARRSNRRQSPS